MSSTREASPEEKRNAIKLKFFDHEKERFNKYEDEYKVRGAVILGGTTMIVSAGVILTGLCTSSLLFIPPMMAAYCGEKLGASVAKCLFKQNTDPSDDDLLEFEENNRYSLK